MYKAERTGQVSIQNEARLMQQGRLLHFWNLRAVQPWGGGLGPTVS